MRLPISIAAAVALLAFAASAHAQTTVGETAPGATEECNYKTNYDELQTSVASGPTYIVPTPGVITSWSTKAREAPGQMLGLKVFRPTETTKFLVVGHDGPHPLTPNLLNSFPVDIPVQAGDLIGLSVPPGGEAGCVFQTGALGDSVGFFEGSAADGSVFSIEGQEHEVRLNVSATVLAPPTITAISPASGSVKGGTSVAITGSNLAEVRSVSFGATPAASFAVNSETQITAVAPSSPILSAQAVGLTTAAGAATSAQTFAYEGCKVPNLSAKKLKATKTKLKSADCKLGKVKKQGGASAKTGKVKSQSPNPGKVLAPGSRVSVKLAG